MIARIRGILLQKSPTSVLIETGGIGFQLHIPVSSMNAIGEPGQEVQLFTVLHVREDALQLFGFATWQEKDLFLQLISVSGIGPRLAQSVLSGISVDDFRAAIHQQNFSALSSIPGIGRKTAERLVVELKDKIGMAAQPGKTEGRTPVSEEAVMALLSLGYKRNQAESVIRKLTQESSMPIEELIRRALREL
jgi:Holliday junction DNA helicase RuvA